MMNKNRNRQEKPLKYKAIKKSQKTQSLQKKADIYKNNDIFMKREKGRKPTAKTAKEDFWGLLA